MHSWVGLREEGKRHFERGDYFRALDCFGRAVSPDLGCPLSEKQLLLSNMVACRLKIGGDDMAAAAVEESKKCIAINERWAKGHVRLASAYIALGGHSNDACNSLQRALTIDPHYPNARQMLLKELGRGRSNPAAAAAAATAAATTGTAGGPHPEPSAPPSDFDYGPPSSQTDRPDDVPLPSSSSSRGSTAPTPMPMPAPTRHPPQSPTPTSATPIGGRAGSIDGEGIDSSFSWRDRLLIAYGRCVTWYHDLNDNVRTLITVAFVLVVLYVAFGGRFGMDSLLSSGHSNAARNRHRGNYGSGNVYEQYRRGHANVHGHGPASDYGRRTEYQSTATNNPRTGSYGSTGTHQQSHPSDRGDKFHPKDDTQNSHHQSQGRYNQYTHSYERVSDPPPRYENSYGTYRGHAPPYYHNGGSYYDNAHSRTNDAYYHSRTSQRQWFGPSYHFSLFDGSMLSIAILLAVSYVCHRNGINPMQVIFTLYVMTRPRRRYHYY